MCGMAAAAAAAAAVPVLGKPPPPDSSPLFSCPLCLHHSWLHTERLCWPGI